MMSVSFVEKSVPFATHNREGRRFDSDSWRGRKRLKIIVGESEKGAVQGTLLELATKNKKQKNRQLVYSIFLSKVKHTNFV